MDIFYMLFQRENACKTNAAAEKVEGGETKLTFVRVDDYSIQG